MGLVKAIKGAAGTVLADQWREYFYCDALGNDVLAVQGRKRVSGKGSNTKGVENIITNGSAVAVNEGQCMMIVDQGRVVEFCAEAGEFIYDSSSEPSLFYGDFGESVGMTFATVGRRFTFGGDAAKDQRIYFFNTKEIMGNKYGTASPVPFRVVDANIGLDMDISLRCNGEYSYKITDPMLFYANVCGNFTGDYTRDNIDSQLKTELLTALQPAFARISEMGVRYSSIPKHTAELADILNEELSAKWSVMGFAAMNMANMAGGMNANALFQMGQQENRGQAAGRQGNAGQPGTFSGTGRMPDGDGETQTGWTCGCGAAGNRGKFCVECGAPKPAAGWTCACGAVNKGKFCSECGKKKPEGEPLYRCDKCGWEPEDPKNPPKFCPECGDPFNEGDIR